MVEKKIAIKEEEAELALKESKSNSEKMTRKLKFKNLVNSQVFLDSGTKIIKDKTRRFLIMISK